MNNLRLALRQLRKAPAFTATALATIAICLGANLARMEIRVMFEHLLDRMPDIHLDGKVERLQSSFINGVKHIPVAFTPVVPVPLPPVSVPPLTDARLAARVNALPAVPAVL